MSTSSAISQIVTRRSRITRVQFGNDLVISACWSPAWVWLAIHWCVATFKPAVPLLNLSDARSIPTKSRQSSKWFPPGCRPVSGNIWWISAAPVVPSFSLQWRSDESTKHLSQILLVINWRYWQAEKIQACVWGFKVSSWKCASLKSTGFSQKINKVGYLYIKLHKW